MASQFLSWSQMNGLPDDILEDSENPISPETSWNDIEKLFNPYKTPFYPSAAWCEALKLLNIDITEANLGIVSGTLHPALEEFNISKITEGCKVERLIVQMTSNIKDRMSKVSDPTGETLCSFHPKVISQFNPVEGSVIIVKNVTVLPELVLNLTLDNIVRILI